jgi:hypothetical protein
VDFEEEDGISKEGDRFRVERDGDHLLCLFQCDLCHFQNIQRRMPGSDPRDEFFEVCIRRANLDALWAREASTVESNRREGRHGKKATETLGVNHEWDRVTGPYAVEDTWGMFEATSILLRSLDPGRKSKFIQHDTMRKLRGHFSSWYKCEAHFSLMDISDDIGGTFYTNQPRFGLWSKRFSQGVHSRMGDNPRPNRSVTLDEMQCIQVLLEEDWDSHITTGHVTGQLIVATNAVVYLVRILRKSSRGGDTQSRASTC